MTHIILILLAGMSINSYNTGGVASVGEATDDIVQSVKDGYSHDTFTSFRLND